MTQLTINPDAGSLSHKDLNSVSYLINGLSTAIPNGIKQYPQKIFDESSWNIYCVFILGLEGSGHHPFGKIITTYREYVKERVDPVDGLTITGFPREFTENYLFPCWKSKMRTRLRQPFNRYNVSWDHNKNNFTLTTGLKYNSACLTLFDELEKVRPKLENNTLIVMPSTISYPFDNVDLWSVPDLNYIFNEFEGITTNKPIKWKIIMMKRPILNVLISVCVHRWNWRLKQCNQRQLIYQYLLSYIQAQIISLDPKYWILIEYNDFFNRTQKYYQVFCGFLHLDCQVMKEILPIAINATHNFKAGYINHTVKKDALTELKQIWEDETEAKQHQYWLNKTYFNFKQWPLFSSDYFNVNPENFLIKKRQIGWP